MSLHPPIRSSRWRGRLAAAVLLALAGTACASVTGPLGEERDRLEQARTQWRSQGLASYSFTFRRQCFCGPGATQPVSIMVRNDTIVSVTSLEDGSPLGASSFDTIDGLFELLDEALDANPATFTAEYDPTRGFPTQAYIDRDVRIADEELGFTATNLQPIR